MGGLDPNAYKGDGDAESYAQKRAAREGHKTEHGPSITGGSPNVRINKHAAWRAEVDTVECTGSRTIVVPISIPGSPLPLLPMPMSVADGPEKVRVGAPLIRINGYDAVRQFDVAVGGGAPNAIIEGSDDVHFGEAGTMGGYGMDDDGLMAAYCKKLCELVAAWPTMTPEQRRIATEALIHGLQDSAGIPRSSVEWTNIAQFDGSTWKLRLPAFERDESLRARGRRAIGLDTEPQEVPLFERDQIPPGLFGGNVVHETRHGQQQIMAARYRIAKNGLENTPANVDRIQKETGLPRRIVEHAFQQPRYPVGSHEYRYAELMDLSVNSGLGGIPEYSLRANERDGKMVGYRGNCHGCC